jgi:multicomponent Na+:H+ antiporter subunit B
MLESYDYSLWLILLGISVAIIFSRSLLQSLIYLVIFSLVSACLYLIMQAPDVAITEAAIGAAISTIFMLLTIRIVGSTEDAPRKSRILGLVVVVAMVLVLCSVVVDIPEYGSAQSPANLGSSHYYITNSQAQTAIPNIVTAILGSYRGVDTMAEVYVILAAMLSALLILPPRVAASKTAKRRVKDAA